jgi:tryptophan-rich sensory protein
LSRKILRPVLIAAAAALVVAVLGGTITDLGSWYESLRKPDWQPPGPAFGIIWTTIYSLTAMAAVLAWRRAPAGQAREWLVGLFAFNGFLNILWSLLFFRFQRPDWALVEVVLLWLSIVALIVFTVRHSRLSGVLLTPYLVWVSIATMLNLEIVRLNGPFG